MRNTWLLLGGLGWWACQDPRPAATLPPPPPVVAFTPVRGGEAPIWEAGKRRMYLSAAPRAPEAMLPGLAVGGPRGPAVAYLGGHVAPLLGLPDTRMAYTLAAGGDPLVVRYSRPDGSPALTVTPLPDLDGRARLLVVGPAVVWLPAGRTSITAEHRGQPSFATPVTAGDDPSVKVILADRIDTETGAYGRVTVETSCVRPRLLQPVPRGSTSVFGLVLGPAQTPDPFYAPAGGEHPELARCGPGTTSTVSFTWP